MLEQRHDKIRQYLYQHGLSSVQTLVEHTDSSLATIRRDLDRLEREGMIVRTRGGAKLADVSGIEVGFRQREHREVQHKRAIAQAAYQHIQAGSSIFLDSSTTALQLARRLRLHPMHLHLTTNSFAAAQELFGVPEVRLLFIGGHIRAENLATVGMYAEEMLDRLWFDQVFISANAVHIEQGLTTFDASEAAINRKMLARASERLLLCDTSKFGKVAPHHIAGVQTLNTIITDDRLSKEWAVRLEQMQVRLETVFSHNEPKSSRLQEDL
jgi:DeoR family transcriptional regulator, aga operon transcriptional repressor